MVRVSARVRVRVRVMVRVRVGVGTVLPCLMPTSTAAAMTCLEVPLCGITWVVRVRVRVRGLGLAWRCGGAGSPRAG